MKTIKRILIITVSLVAGMLLVISAHAQGTFLNLGFETPLLPLIPTDDPPQVAFTDAFPGWVGYVGTNLADRVRIDGLNLSLATLALIRSNVSGPPPAPLIAGNYTAVLEAGTTTYGGPRPVDVIPVALAQTSLVPVGSRSLLFKGFTVGTNFTVTLGEVVVPVFPLQAFSNYTLYGGDITGSAGSVAELRFTAFPNNYPNYSIFALDSIVFSPDVIPEPGVFGLLGLGGLFLGWRRLSNKSRS